MLEIKFTMLHEGALTPRNAYGNDAGWDLAVIEDYLLVEGQGVDMRTGLAVAIPDGYYGRIVARSSTMRKRGLMVMEGIIDAGFRGELFSYVYMPADPLHLKVDQQMGSKRSVSVQRGESVAQLIIQRVEPITFVCFPKHIFERSTASARGTQGFGSSGS